MMDKHSTAIRISHHIEGITVPTSLCHMLAKGQAGAAEHFASFLVSKTRCLKLEMGLSEEGCFRRYVQTEQGKHLALPGETVCSDLGQPSRLISSVILPFINEDNSVC